MAYQQSGKSRLYFRATKILRFVKTEPYSRQHFWIASSGKDGVAEKGKITLTHPHSQSLLLNQVKMQKSLETWQEFENF